uniref:Uncharacterized protein n=1 Tax=Pyxicephalus adspersus TaxID=30357 RepID=A0AAV3B5V7_PYXAD|nr:TPA: hypothetical protein GDO54_000555 [Pyxicephalus adspersus]
MFRFSEQWHNSWYSFLYRIIPTSRIKTKLCAGVLALLLFGTPEKRAHHTTALKGLVMFGFLVFFVLNFCKYPLEVADIGTVLSLTLFIGMNGKKLETQEQPVLFML